MEGKKREVEVKTKKISSKLGAMMIKELINKQYKMNYYQKIKAQSQAFYKWKAMFKQVKQVQEANKARKLSKAKKRKAMK